MLSVVMPMAGLGTRFSAQGETLPKPLIPIHGVPMFRIALGAVRHACPVARVICIVLAEHQASAGLADLIAEAEPAARVVVIPELTGGPLQTCLAAEPHLATTRNPLIVLDCDLAFRAPAYFAALQAMASGADDSAGLLLSFRAKDPRYSFAEVAEGRVLRTAEKQPISDNALLGAYGFAAPAPFFAAAHDVIRRNLRVGNGEFYVSSAYNELIGRGHRVRLVQAERHWSLGTPEEVAANLGDPDLVELVTSIAGQRNERA